MRHHIPLPKASGQILWVLSHFLSLSFWQEGKICWFFFSTEVSFLTLQKESTTWFLKSQFRNQSAHQAHRWRARRAKTISRAPWSFPRIEENYLIQQYNTSQQHKSNGGDLTLLYTLKLRILVCLHGHVWGEWPSVWWRNFEKHSVKLKFDYAGMGKGKKKLVKVKGHPGILSS